MDVDHLKLVFIFLLDCTSGFIRIDNGPVTTKCNPSLQKLFWKTPGECIQEAIHRGIDSVAYNNGHRNCNLKHCADYDYDLMLLAQPQFTTYTAIYSC